MKTKVSAWMLAVLIFAGLPLASSSGYVAVSVGFAPPPIPVYEQPLCPGPGYIWVPGYWAYGPYGYYWVPGEWVLAPGIGLYWTPGYWGFAGGSYVFHEGYWGPTVGFYGGINYGYGYWGHGYYGGRWVGNTFQYNTVVTRVNKTVVRNTYADRSVLKNRVTTKTSFNGPGGVQARPTAEEQAAEKAKRMGPTDRQRSVAEAAKNEPGLRAKENKGKPKPDAVRAFREKHRAEAAGAESNEAATNTSKATERRGAETTAGENRNRAKTNAENQKARAAETNRSHKAEQANRRTEQPRERATTRSHNKPSGVSSTAARHPEIQHPAARRPQTAQRAPAGSARAAHVTNQSSEKAKKKARKKPDEGH
jgi:hypothetical protein